LVVRLEEITIFKKRISELEDEKQRLSLELKAVQNDVKNTSNKLLSKEEEYRKKILSLEATIETKDIELATNSQQMSADLEREKANLTKELQNQDEAMRNIEQESKFRIDQLES
jgi:chromosome segregation ATPase